MNTIACILALWLEVCYSFHTSGKTLSSFCLLLEREAWANSPEPTHANLTLWLNVFFVLSLS